MNRQKLFDGRVIQRLITNADQIRNHMIIPLHVSTKNVLYCDNKILDLHLEVLYVAHEYR